MDQRTQLIGDWLSGAYTKAQLHRLYGVSRPTIDKWIGRYEREGAGGLYERSRARLCQARAVPEAIGARIIAAKRQHPWWGPKKIMAHLRVSDPATAWPADSTAGELLKRAGWVQPRKYRRRAPPRDEPLAHCRANHQVWSTDFKGDYVLGNRQRCYPLTISDNHNRFLLACHALGRTDTAAVRPCFEAVFREHGLPERIRSDNGAPFASLALGGLSALSVWWIRLGIRPERITPGRPSENGRHERMHRTLKAEATQPPSPDFQDQQHRFDAFAAQYNQQRPHEALEHRTPAQCYSPSPRPYPDKLPPVQYDIDVSVRSVRSNGEIKWRGRLIYVSQVLVGEPIALEVIDTGLWAVRYSFHHLGMLDERRMTIHPSARNVRTGPL